MYHAQALLLVGVMSAAPGLSPRWLRFATFAFGFGIVVFSGSLYLLALTGLGWLGAVTPIGGLAFIQGWIALIAAGLSRSISK